MYITYVRNRTPMSMLGYRTPYARVYGKPPNVKELPVWGSVCFAHAPAVLRKHKKLSALPVSVNIGRGKRYRLWDIYNNKYNLSRDVQLL
ncbi:Retrovirus-related Pol Polyprotein from transposon TNT 1-94 [Phytophthora megakarya]|uniref:Retrovirus-related Pol Polyprotein from transposon TNT 1-94 n=1 Tax=Phytophthora megakarya TaxID=4795 RepID=A0A225WNE7_9STRA|nr:Retrovirus-related Pol Polyprotein from transposon TNT 1-94 [Phytophthora megakarya]